MKKQLVFGLSSDCLTDEASLNSKRIIQLQAEGPRIDQIYNRTPASAYSATGTHMELTFAMRSLPFLLALCFLLTCSKSFAGQVAENGKETAKVDAALSLERKQQLEQIRQARAEAKKRVLEAEQSLASLRAANATQGGEALQSWSKQIIAAIEGKWVRPPIEETGTAGCTASIVIADTGDVVSVSFELPCSPQSLKASIEAAILKTSPLPLPADPAVFSRRLIVHFAPKDEAQPFIQADAASRHGSTKALQLGQIPYKNDAQVHGAALNSLLTKRPMVERAIALCVRNDPSFEARARSVTTAWLSRNGKYLPIAPLLLAEIKANAIAEGASTQWNEFESISIPKQIEHSSQILTGQIEVAPAGVQRKALCESVAAAIDDGLLDFTNDDPRIVSLLDSRLLSLSN